MAQVERDKEECLRVFRAALWHLDRNSSLGSDAMFLRELMMTAGCDRVYDLSALRQEVSKDIGEGSMDRIVGYQETGGDIRRANQIVFRHREWARWQLSAALGKMGWWQRWCM